MEGKNCFQTRWSQNPLYSGGNIASVYLLPSAASAATDEESQEVTPSSSSKVGPLCLVTACESTCHLIDAATGNALASFTIPLNDEDVILSIDAVTISQKNRNNNSSSSSIPQEEEAAAAAATAAESSKKKKSVAKKKETTQTRNTNDDAEEENDDALPNMKETDEDAKFASGAFDGTYIAFSTRQVQIYLLQVVATTSSTTTTTSYTLKLVRNWTASQHAISLVQFAKHGQWLIAGSTDGNVKVWNAFSFFLLHQLHCPHGVITSIALSPRQDRMAVGNFDGWVTLFDMGAKRKIAGKRVHTSAVESILLWARRPTSTSTTRTGVEEDEFVSVGRDRKIAFVSFDKQSQPQQQTGGGSGLVLVERRAIVVMEFLTCARFEQRDIDDGSFFLHLGAQDGVVATYRVHPTNTVQRICKTDRPKIRSSSSNGADPAAAEGAELDEENAIRCIVLPAQEYRDALFAAHSATGGYDSTHPDALPVMSEGSHPPHDLSKRDSSAISSSSSLTSTVALFAANSSFNVHYLERHHASSRYTVLTTLVGFLDQILDIKLIPEPTQSLLTLPRLVVTNAKEVLVFQGEGGDGSSALCRARLEGHEDVVMCCAVTPDGRYAATGGKDRRVLVWDLCTYRCVAVGEGTHPSFDPSSSSSKGTRSNNSELGHHGDISNVHFNVRVDAESFFMLVSVGSDESIRFWDVGQSLKAGGVKRGARKQLEGDQDDASMSSSSAAVSLELSAAVNQAHDGPIHALSVSPNDQYVATGGKDKVVLLWAVRGKKLFKEATLRGHRRGITSLSFSSHDRIVASASNDGTVKVWSLSSLSCVKTLQHDKVGVLTFGFFNKSSQVVTCNLEGVLRVWALASSEVVSTQDIHDSKVWALAIKEAAAPAASSSSAPSSSLVILTGSSTGTVIATEDITAQEAQRLTEERHEAIYNEQQLQNALRQKNFVDAFTLALKLNHPRHLRQVVARWSVTDAEQCSEKLSQEILPSLQDEQLKRLISYVQDWSSNARHSNVASLVLEAFLNAFHFSESVEKHSFLKDALESLLSYSARHSTRLHSALHRTYLLQYLLRSATAETDERSADDEQRQQMCDGGVLTREPPQAAIMDTVLGKLLTASPKKRARE